MYKVRRKRDTVENIYRQCQITGQCPPDVVNKVEQTTLADYLLKIFGSIIYLGGLGIGTGSGAGSATGFRPLPENIPLPPRTTTDIPLPEAPSIETTARPIRPSRPTTFGTRIDPISSASNRPRPVNPRGPAIVPLSENGLPDATITINGGGSEVLTNTDVFEDITTVNGHPTVLHGQEEIAILEVTPAEAPPHRIAFEYPRTNTAVTVVESSAPSPADLNIFVDPTYAGEHIGEEIELDPINTIAEFEIEEPIPKTSTPSRILERTVGRARRLYSRFVEQAPTRNVTFLGQPSRAILFEYENPAFSDDVTLNFERDLQEVAAAPDATFADVIQLNRPQFSETKEGLVRFSRMGTRGKVSTRSGAVLRQKVHFYYDLSPIASAPAPENIKLDVLEDSSDALTVVDELSRSTFVNPVFEINLGEDTILDDLQENFQNSHLALLNETEEEQVLIPTLVTDVTPSTFPINDYSNGIYIGPNTANDIPFNPHAITPAIYIEALGSDYYLHPSMLKRRKRKYSEIF